MWMKTRLSRLLAAATWLCACSSEPPAAGSRAAAPGRDLAAAGSAAPAVNASDSTPRAQAGSSAPIIKTSSAPPQVGTASNPNACEVVQLTAEPQVPDMMIVQERRAPTRCRRAVPGGPAELMPPRL
jgi:hypothetical protein